MRNYKFDVKELDIFELVLSPNEKDEERIEFKRTLETAKILQSGEATARFKMLQFMISQGVSKKDLVIEKVVDGKTVIDETNYRDFEEHFMNEERVKLTDNIIKQVFNFDTVELIKKLKLENETSAAKFPAFMQEFRNILTSDPSSEIPSGTSA